MIRFSITLISIMAADIYDKKYNVTKCNQTFEHKKIAPNLDKLKA